MKMDRGEGRKVFIEVLGDESAAAVAIVSEGEHHTSQVLAAPRASKSIFIRTPKALTSTAKDRPENPFAVKAHGRRPAPNKRFALFHAEIKRNTPTCSDPVRAMFVMEAVSIGALEDLAIGAEEK
jgi:hypothetical protein